MVSCVTQNRPARKRTCGQAMVVAIDVDLWTLHKDRCLTGHWSGAALRRHVPVRGSQMWKGHWRNQIVLLRHIFHKLAGFTMWGYAYHIPRIRNIVAGSNQTSASKLQVTSFIFECVAVHNVTQRLGRSCKCGASLVCLEPPREKYKNMNKKCQLA